MVVEVIGGYLANSLAIMTDVIWIYYINISGCTFIQWCIWIFYFNNIYKTKLNALEFNNDLRVS